MFKRLGPLVSLITVVMLFLFVATPPVFAATTADVTVNATPAYVSISVSPIYYGFGTVAVSANYSTSQGYFTVTNGSSVLTNCTVGTNATTWAGGITWTHSDTGTPGVDTAALYASANTGGFDIIVKYSSPNNLVTNQSATTNWQWELRLMSPTELNDGVLKAIKVRLTASAS